jgi:ABC-type antimicrobial peptide transport system permease subunit
VAFPLAYWVMKQWLSGFAYQVEINFTIFIVVAFTALGIAFVTIAFQAWRATRTNPATVLKTE